MVPPSGPKSAGAGVGESPPGSARILLAEDNSLNRTILRDFLSRLGYRVAMAEHGAEAVEMAEAGGFDLILLDIQMPVMDGLEAVARIRLHQERSGGPRVPVLALTAFAANREIREHGLSDFDRVLTKPLDLAEMKHTLRELLPDHAPPGQSESAAAERAAAKPATGLPPQLRQGFLADTPPRMDKARELLALGELEALQALAHYLVNSALAVKAPDMAGAARSLEAACLERDLSMTRGCLESLEAAVREVSARFQAESGRA